MPSFTHGKRRDMTPRQQLFARVYDRLRKRAQRARHLHSWKRGYQRGASDALNAIAERIDWTD